MKSSPAAHGLSARILFWILGFGAVFLGVTIGRGSYEMAHSSLSFWFTAIFGVLGGILMFVPFMRIGKTGFQPESPSAQSVEDRLDELDRFRRRDMVTPEEYAAKRQEILKDL